MKAILDLIARHKAGEPCGIFSVCSAHPLVIEATFRPRPAVGRALRADRGDLESGQSGRRLYRHEAGGLPRLRPWHRGSRRPAARSRSARRRPSWSQCLAGAAGRGGDGTRRRADRGLCSRGLPQDPSRLLDVVRGRSGAAIRRDDRAPCGAPLRGRRTRPCRAPEESRRSMSSAPRSRFPVAPRKSSDTLAVTTPEAARATIDTHRAIFAAAGLADAWPRVIAVVVQPGVEFDHRKVVGYVPEKAHALSRMIESCDGLIFEAHSTDYQSTVRARGAGAGSLRDPEGRPRRDLCAARGALGAGRDRARMDRARLGLRLPQCRHRAHEGRAAALGQILSRARRRLSIMTCNTA